MTASRDRAEGLTDMGEMRAALYDAYGPPEVLYEGTVPAPVAGPGELLVRVTATSVNGGELMARAGRLPFAGAILGRGFPKRTGVDFAGTVTAVGSAITGFAVGDTVWGAAPYRFGAASEYVTMPASRLAPAPVSVDAVQAASLPAVGATAIIALRGKAHLLRGERLLVRGASGGVGSVAVQLGRELGARVTALASARNLDFVRELGATEAFDYATTRPADLGRFDVVLDTVGSDLAAYRRLLARGGRMIAIAFDVENLATSLGYIATSGVFGPRRVRFFRGDAGQGLLIDLARLVDSGAIRPVVASVHPLADIAEAHRALETGGIRGKIVVRVEETA